MAECLEKMLEKLQSILSRVLTRGPSGPSRTAQTAVPHTAQFLHLQLWRSLQKSLVNIPDISSMNIPVGKRATATTVPSP
jgi:hypothetical protein